jgi:hypothetical protein
VRPPCAVELARRVRWLSLSELLLALPAATDCATAEAARARPCAPTRRRRLGSARRLCAPSRRRRPPSEVAPCVPPPSRVLFAGAAHPSASCGGARVAERSIRGPKAKARRARRRRACGWLAAARRGKLGKLGGVLSAGAARPARPSARRARSRARHARYSGAKRPNICCCALLRRAMRGPHAPAPLARARRRAASRPYEATRTRRLVALHGP